MTCSTPFYYLWKSRFGMIDVGICEHHINEGLQYFEDERKKEQEKQAEQKKIAEQNKRKQKEENKKRKRELFLKKQQIKLFKKNTMATLKKLDYKNIIISIRYAMEAAKIVHYSREIDELKKKLSASSYNKTEYAALTLIEDSLRRKKGIIDSNIKKNQNLRYNYKKEAKDICKGFDFDQLKKFCEKNKEGLTDESYNSIESQLAKKFYNLYIK